MSDAFFYSFQIQTDFYFMLGGQKVTVLENPFCL
jgi:hypothetical protein